MSGWLDALWYGDYEEFVNQREGRAVNVTAFGGQEVRTKVYHVLPDETPRLDVSLLIAEAEAQLAAAGGANEEAWVL